MTIIVERNIVQLTGVSFGLLGIPIKSSAIKEFSKIVIAVNSLQKFYIKLKKYQCFFLETFLAEQLILCKSMGTGRIRIAEMPFCPKMEP